MDEVRVAIDLSNIKMQAGTLLDMTLGSLKEVMAEEGLPDEQVGRIFHKWADRMLEKKNQTSSEGK